MKNDEMIILRANILGGFDAYIRDVIGDDDITDRWDMFGVPDGADEEEIMEIAEDEHEWARICGYFGTIVQTLAMDAESEVSG